jgi:hypothetical protein
VDDEPTLIERVIRFIDPIRQLVGSVILLCLAVAFLVMGNTFGRLVGVVLFAGCIAIGISLVRRSSFR